MKLRSLAGLVAAVLVLPASAYAGPTVSVRVEGAAGTLLERTRVTLPDTVFAACTQPHTAASAIEEATRGDWDRQAFTQTILGETHRFDDFDYWAEWVDRGAGPKVGSGICNDVLAEGDEVVMLVDRSPEGTPTVFPLDLEGVPAQATAGDTITITAVEYRSPTGAVGEGERTPVAGATVTAGGAGATTGPDGRATLMLDRPGAYAVKATRPGNAASGAEPLTVVERAAGPPPPPPLSPGPDLLAPLGRIEGIREQQRFRRRRAPRELRGTVAPDPSGLRNVKLRLTRQVGRRCWYFSGSRERFLRRRCGTRHKFLVGEDARWSYLLPRRLPRGRYVLDVFAMDRARNVDTLERGRSRVVFRVR